MPVAGWLSVHDTLVGWVPEAQAMVVVRQYQLLNLDLIPALAGSGVCFCAALPGMHASRPG